MRKKKTEKTIEDYFYLTGCIFFLLVVLLEGSRILMPETAKVFHMPPCLFHLLTGFYCPGCGGTRALQTLFHGQILRSVYYHPLVLYGAVIYLYFMTTQTIERLAGRRFPIGMHYHNRYVWIAVTIILMNFLTKNALHYFCGFLL